MREVDLDRVHAGNVMHHNADLPSVMGKACLPLCLGKCGRKCSERCCAGLETGGEGLRPVVHLCATSGRNPEYCLQIISVVFKGKQSLARRKQVLKCCRQCSCSALSPVPKVGCG